MAGRIPRMSKPELKVVTLYESNFQDPVATLRKLADDIESGKYGDVASLGVVLAGCLQLNDAAWSR